MKEVMANANTRAHTHGFGSPFSGPAAPGLQTAEKFLLPDASKSRFSRSDPVEMLRLWPDAFK